MRKSIRDQAANPDPALKSPPVDFTATTMALSSSNENQT
jgi:hypothetical protein